MKVVIYQNCLPSKNKNPEKPQALQHFQAGATAAGDRAVLYSGYDVQECNVAVILGWVHESSKNSPHLRLRQAVIDYQISQQRHVVIIDSNLFLYRDVKNPRHYLRYSFNGVFPTTGNYCDQSPVVARWEQLKRSMGLVVKPWRQSGSHILLCLQRHGGWSMGSKSVVDWTAETILQLRRYTDRPIRIRAHPGDKNAAEYLGQFQQEPMLNNVSLSAPNQSLLADLHDCWAVVNHNSSPAVGAAIEGVPVFLTDAERSQARDIANSDLAMIENPSMPDRSLWLQRLAMSHWNFDDLQLGHCWRHMRSFI